MYCFFLCSGAYADVVRGWDLESNEPVAVKVVSRVACQKYFELMNKEVAVMQIVGDHPHLLTMREVCNQLSFGSPGWIIEPKYGQLRCC